MPIKDFERRRDENSFSGGLESAMPKRTYCFIEMRGCSYKNALCFYSLGVVAGDAFLKKGWVALWRTGELCVLSFEVLSFGLGLQGNCRCLIKWGFMICRNWQKGILHTRRVSKAGNVPMRGGSKMWHSETTAGGCGEGGKKTGRAPKWRAML
ncbi:hypothetical protein BY457_109136 [Marinilabilia salmonicolor]|jgi:hypothetical protein|nr:hypothetical protein BY457_109136 [Marinilabilia salmonicolor]